MKAAAILLAALLATAPTAAAAADDGTELWFNPSIAFDLDDDTAVELETAQRFRDNGDGRADTYFARLWLLQDLSDDLTLGGAVEQRINDGAANETRVIQQLSASPGVLRGRLRLEQRFVDGADRVGLRLRPRLGVSVPLGDDERWSVGADAELFWTLRSTSSGGDTGITGLRTQAVVGYDVSDRLGLSVGYLRQQDIRPGRPDTVGHAPIIGIEVSL